MGMWVWFAVDIFSCGCDLEPIKNGQDLKAVIGDVGVSLKLHLEMRAGLKRCVTEFIYGNVGVSFSPYLEIGADLFDCTLRSVDVSINRK